MNEKKLSGIIMITEEDMEIFASIINIRDQAEKQFNEKITLEQALAMYVLSKIMSGIYFMDFNSDKKNE
jgi:hypothetical protein